MQSISVILFYLWWCYLCLTTNPLSGCAWSRNLIKFLPWPGLEPRTW